MHTRYFIFFLLSIFFIPEIFAQDKYSIGLNGRNFDKHEATGTILIVDSRASAEKVSVYEDRTRAGSAILQLPRSKFRILFLL